MSSIIDVHAHIGHNIHFDNGQTYDEYITTMDRVGIEKAIISVATGGRQVDGLADSIRQNDTIAEAMRAHPDRFPVGLGCVEVRHAEKAVEELERCFTELHLQGMVFHPTFEGIILGWTKVLDPLFELASEHRALCLYHATDDILAPPKALGELADRYPDVTLLMGHPAMTVHQREECVEAARGRENVWVDLAYQEDPETTEYLVEKLGGERVLFGSDAPFYDIDATIASIHTARISDEVRERILYGNGADLVGRFARESSAA
jgi:predicted TIM-barrel fold metal-dependent hydrolase